MEAIYRRNSVNRTQNEEIPPDIVGPRFMGKTKSKPIPTSRIEFDAKELIEGDGIAYKDGHRTTQQLGPFKFVFLFCKGFQLHAPLRYSLSVSPEVQCKIHTNLGKPVWYSTYFLHDSIVNNSKLKRLQPTFSDKRDAMYVPYDAVILPEIKKIDAKSAPDQQWKYKGEFREIPPGADFEMKEHHSKKEDRFDSSLHSTLWEKLNRKEYFGPRVLDTRSSMTPPVETWRTGTFLVCFENRYSTGIQIDLQKNMNFKLRVDACMDISPYLGTTDDEYVFGVLRKGIEFSLVNPPVGKDWVVFTGSLNDNVFQYKFYLVMQKSNGTYLLQQMLALRPI